MASSVSCGWVARFDPAARSVLRLCVAVFVCGTTFGAFMPVVSVFVGRELGFGDIVTGTAVSLHFLATLLTRTYAGREADRLGASVTLRRGLLSCAVACAVLAIVPVLKHAPALQLTGVLLSRLCSGLGESQLITGALAWGIGLVGPNRAGRVMAWNGMALYGAIAIGAPAGIALMRAGGVALPAIVGLGLPFVAWLAVRQIAAVPAVGTRGGRMRSVVARVWRPGSGLALQGVGFAAIGSFVPLYFSARQWANSGLALTAFGFAFVASRFWGGTLPDRFGGYRVALASLGVEAAGQLLMAWAPDARIAIAGAGLTGFGCSLVFPSLGSMTIRLLPEHQRALTIGTFTAFQDVAYFVTGPLVGCVAAWLGYAAVFGTGALAACAGAAVVALDRHRP